MRTTVLALLIAAAGCGPAGSAAPASGHLASDSQTAESPAADGPTASERKEPALVLAQDADWEQLNPARGDKSPMAATLWGNRQGRGPTGFLFHAIDGFESPPHVHNVAYRGVVIRGAIHNDAPDAEYLWMPPGSYWTQPEGGVHITAARGADVLAYIEIDDGPYLVYPVDKAFEGKERPKNLEPGAIAWSSSSDGIERAVLWGGAGKSGPTGMLLRLPAEFTGRLRSDAGRLRAVVVQGRLQYGASGAASPAVLEPGSYVSTLGEVSVEVACAATLPCVLYVRSDGAVDVVSPTATP